MVRFHGLTEDLAVATDPTDGDAAEVDAVIALLASDEAGLRRFAFGTPISARHFQRGVGGL